MPWKACKPMDERLKFIARLLDGEKMAAVCRDFNVSRKTGYKILQRYNDVGLEGLTDRSRRPYRHANQLPVQIETLIVRCKQDKPHWGAPKIRERLARLYPDVHTPATRCRRSSAARARARRPLQSAEAATPSNFFLCRDPGAGFAPSCLGECAIAARHEPEHRTMWYRKNVGGWERAARLIGGGLMLICGVVALHASPLGLLLSGAGVVTLVTGVFGYCPACAIAGREPLKG
jgi:DUF2892 family protein/homeodomain-containing protein